MTTPDIDAAAREMWRDLCEKDDRTSPEEYPDMALITEDEVVCIYKSALSTLAESEAFVEAAAKGGLAEFCQPRIAVSWSELQPAAKAKWTKIARAALRAGLDAALGRKP